jgi:hypothetical protein
MSKVKYRVREYNTTSAQQGSHIFFAEAVINNEITNNELAEKIASSYWRKGLRGDNGHRSHRRHYQRGGAGEQPH